MRSAKDFPATSSPSRSAIYFLFLRMNRLTGFVLCVLLAVVQSSKSSKKIDFSEIPKTDSDSGAPLILQKNSEKNHLLKLFLTKYGLSGTKKAPKSGGKHVSTNANGKSNKKESSDEGWVYGYIYTGTTCSGTEYVQGGLKLGQCIPVTSDESFYLKCSDDGLVTLYKYEDETCTSLTDSYYIAETGCGTTSSWYTDDSVSTENSVQLSCSTTSTPHYEEEADVEYDISQFFASTSSSSCADDDMVFYEAFPTETCIPMSYKSYGYSSIKFEMTTSESPYVEYYTSSKTCSGTGKTASLTTTCSSIYKNGYDLYYKITGFKSS